MKGKLYYKITLYNKINNNIIQYNKNISNCIPLLNIIEKYYRQASCNSRILKYINKRFYNNYKIKDTNSIIINYNNKELYSYINELSINNTYTNNIKIYIYEEYLLDNIKKIELACNKNNNNNNKKIKEKTNDSNINRKDKSKFKYMRIKEFKNFNKYLKNINNIRNKLMIKTKDYNKNKLLDNLNDTLDHINNILEINIIKDEENPYNKEYKMDKTFKNYKNLMKN